jgi:shikimate dehydrogenase
MADLYGLIGKKLAHSQSKQFFTTFFDVNKINASYKLFELKTIHELPVLLQNNPDLKGLNVTIPYKQEVLPFLDEIDFDAKMIGAVNAIAVVQKKGKIVLRGFNTDAFGFDKSLQKVIQVPNKKKALILGTGGAARAVRYLLRKNGIIFKSVGRTGLKSDELTYNEITPQLIEEFEIIINTTPLGMFPHLDDAPKIPYQSIGKDHILMDLIYNPAETIFLKEGKQRGAVTINGQEMFVLQASKSWELWQKHSF